MDIHEKTKAIILHLEMNNNSFARKMRVSSSTVDSITTGRLQPNGTRKKTKPGYDVLQSMIHTFNINPDYLFGLSQQMLLTKTSKIKEVITLNEQILNISNRLDQLEKIISSK